MADSNVLINKLLCFVWNHFDKIPRNELLNAFNGFYDDDEVLMAKEVLFDWASKIDGTPRVKTRKESATRRRLEC